MIAIRLTEAFRDWRDGLRDKRAKVAIARRIDRLALGNPGDVKPVGEGVSEMRIALWTGIQGLFYTARHGISPAFVRRGQEHAGQGYQAGEGTGEKLDRH